MAGALAKSAEPAGQSTDIGSVDVKVGIEEYLIAVSGALDHVS